MRRILAAIVIILIVIGIAFAVTNKSDDNSNSNNTPPSNQPSANQPQTNNQASNSTAPKTGTINIVNMLFTSSQITIAKGGTVTWTNNDSTTHTVVDDLSNSGGPNSGDIAPGQSYSFTFEKTGSFQYHCSIHPSMRGTIVVK